MQNYLIIGGSSGIGNQLATQLAESGKQVIATFNTNKPEADTFRTGFGEFALFNPVAGDH